MRLEKSEITELRQQIRMHYWEHDHQWDPLVSLPVGETPRLITHGKGTRLHTAEGHELLDLVGGMECVNGAMLSRGGEWLGQGNHIFLVNHHIWLTHWIPDWDTGVTLALGEWRHLATTWDGTTERLYVDGEPAWSNSWGGPLDVAGGSTTFGKHDNVDSYT